jgi:hypothetical protein
MERDGLGENKIHGMGREYRFWSRKDMVRKLYSSLNHSVVQGIFERS